MALYLFYRRDFQRNQKLFRYQRVFFFFFWYNTSGSNCSKMFTKPMFFFYQKWGNLFMTISSAFLIEKYLKLSTKLTQKLYTIAWLYKYVYIWSNIVVYSIFVYAFVYVLCELCMPNKIRKICVLIPHVK